MVQTKVVSIKTDKQEKIIMSRKRLVIYSLLLSAVLMGCGHRHQWSEADCIAPATCKICGETQGDLQDHVWKEATCTEPRVCTVCGKTEGDSLGHKWKDATTENPKTCSVCGETEGEALKKAIVSDWAFQNVWYISDRYLMVVSPDEPKLFLIDYEGNKVPGGAFSEDIETEWDKASINMQDGCFICRVEREDGTYRSYLIDQDLNVLINFEDPKGYIQEYRDNCWKAFYPGENRVVYYPMDPDNPDLKGVSLSLDEYIWFAQISNGFYLYRRKNLNSYGDNPFGSFEIMVTGDSLSLRGRRYKVNNEDIAFTDNSVSEEGWAAAKTGNWEENAEGGRFSFKDSSFGFYNIKTNKYVPNPPGVKGYDLYMAKNGCGRCPVVNGLAALAETTDPFLYRIFNLYTGEYETEETYRYIGLRPNGHFPVKNMDEKWGYLDSSDFRHVGEWYDDATSFCNGYALINKNGKEYLINEDLEIVSEGFDGKSAVSAYLDYLDFRSEDKGVVFFMNDGENYHLVKFE